MTHIKIVVDGDPRHTYTPGDKVRGTVVLVTERQEPVKSIDVCLKGECITETTRPYYVSSYGENQPAPASSNRPYKEVFPLFTDDKVLMSGPFTLAANTYEWPFEFVFPDSTQFRRRRRSHSHYTKENHPLPPTFFAATNHPGGYGCISYRVQATLVRGGFNFHKLEADSHELLFKKPSKYNPIQPKPAPRSLDPYVFKRCKPRVRFLPTLYAPKAVMAGQCIPLLLSMKYEYVREKDSGAELSHAMIESLEVQITTHTRIQCGSFMSNPEDHVSKTVTCVKRSGMGVPLTLDNTPAPLVHEFRLVDNAECVPSFRSYTISRYYTISVFVGLQCAGQPFTIEAHQPLDIVEKHEVNPTRELILQPLRYPEDIDPLPKYVKEPDQAPEYDGSGLATAGPARALIQPQHKASASDLISDELGMVAVPTSERRRTKTLGRAEGASSRSRASNQPVAVSSTEQRRAAAGSASRPRDAPSRSRENVKVDVTNVIMVARQAKKRSSKGKAPATQVPQGPLRHDSFMDEEKTESATAGMRLRTPHETPVVDRYRERQRERRAMLTQRYGHLHSHRVS